MTSTPTPGPWRWEISESGKQVHLCGGVPKFDLNVMDFVRWGMGSAAPRFRDNSDMGLMQRAEGFAVEVAGREHHAKWFKGLKHPDAQLIEAAPCLYAACKAAKQFMGTLTTWTNSDLAQQSEAFAVLQSIKAALLKAEGGAR